MRKRTRIFLYILLNIFISSASVLVVLWIWESKHPAPQIDQNQTFIPNSENSSPVNPAPGLSGPAADPTESLTFVKEDLQVDIHAIVGPGNLEVEYVEIHNLSPGPIDMTGWQLTDQDEQVFTFPPLILNQGGGIKVLSKKGNNTVIELYWQSEVPIWQSGETASLLNADGETITTYSIP